MTDPESQYDPKDLIAGILTVLLFLVIGSIPLASAFGIPYWGVLKVGIGVWLWVLAIRAAK